MTAPARKQGGGDMVLLQRRYTQPDQLTEGMAELSARYNVLTPVRQVSHVPMGHAVVLSAVNIDPREAREGGETFRVDGGRRALSKSALDKLASAAGVSWVPERSGRLDNASDPHYCHFRAVGVLTDLDGAERVISGEKEMDLRDGSPQVAELERIAEKKGRSAEGQVSQMRLHILAHAESKAKLRAVRQACCVRGGYTQQDLQRPFVVPRLVETGDFGDPDLNREYARLKMRKMLGMGGPAESLFGPPDPTPGLGRAEPTTAVGAGHSRREATDAEFTEVDPDQAVPFDVLDDAAQVRALVSLLRSRGRLGQGDGRYTEADVRKWTRRQREGAHAKLSAMPAESER